MNNSIKWSWLKVPLKVEQINEYLLLILLYKVNTKYAVYDMKVNDCKNEY